MKANIHPEQKEVEFVCECGNTFKAMSTANKNPYHVEVCSECHPFYTGAQGKHKRTGNVEKFRRKYNIQDAE